MLKGILSTGRKSSSQSDMTQLSNSPNSPPPSIQISIVSSSSSSSSNTSKTTTITNNNNNNNGRRALSLNNGTSSSSTSTSSTSSTTTTPTTPLSLLSPTSPSTNTTTSINIKDYEFSFESIILIEEEEEEEDGNKKKKSMKNIFREYLELTHNVEPYMFIDQFNQFQKLNQQNKNNHERFQMARSMNKQFIKPNSQFELNISNSLREEVINQIKLIKQQEEQQLENNNNNENSNNNNNNNISVQLFDKIYLTILKELKEDVFPKFLEHSLFVKYFMERMSSATSRDSFLNLYHIKLKKPITTTTTPTSISPTSISPTTTTPTSPLKKKQKKKTREEIEIEEEEDESFSFMDMLKYAPHPGSSNSNSSSILGGGGGTNDHYHHSNDLLENESSSSSSSSSSRIQLDLDDPYFTLNDFENAKIELKDVNLWKLIDSNNTHHHHHDTTNTNTTNTNNGHSHHMMISSELYVSKKHFYYDMMNRRGRGDYHHHKMFHKYKETCLLPFNIEEVMYSFMDEQFMNSITHWKDIKCVEYYPTLSYNRNKMASSVTQFTYSHLPFPFKNRDCVISSSAIRRRRRRRSVRGVYDNEQHEEEEEEMEFKKSKNQKQEEETEQEEEYEYEYMILRKSVNDMVPKRKGYKRAITIQQILIEKVFDHVTRFTCSTFIDMRGSINSIIWDAIASSSYYYSFRIGLVDACNKRRSSRLQQQEQQQQNSNNNNNNNNNSNSKTTITTLTTPAVPPKSSYRLYDTMIDNGKNMTIKSKKSRIITL